MVVVTNTVAKIPQKFENLIIMIVVFNYELKFRMFSRYRNIKEDGRFSAAEDKGQYSVCPVSAAKLMSFISFCLLLSPFIFKASGACES